MANLPDLPCQLPMRFEKRIGSPAKEALVMHLYVPGATAVDANVANARRLVIKSWLRDI